MRKISILWVAGLALLAGCFSSSQPPVGRWIGNHEAPGILVDTRLEILPDGRVRVSAPNFLNADSDISEEQRVDMRARLADELNRTWSQVVPRKMDFDGRTFRKPGGVAPQMEWDAATRQMKVVFYFGMHKSIRIDVRQVDVFGDDPWAATQ
jgi:hypothetical protein